MISVNVVVGDEHAATIGEVAARLRAAGMTVGTVLDVIISGSVPDEARLHALEGVEGVRSVSPELLVQLPPPDADIQ